MKTNYQLHKVEETPRRVHTLDLDEADRIALGIAAPADHELTDRELTDRYVRLCGMTFEEAQNRATATLAKLRPRRAQTVAVAREGTVAFAVPPPPRTLAAEPEQDRLAAMTDLLVRSGRSYDDAQCEALRALADPSGFNPPPMDPATSTNEVVRQEYLNCVYELTALLQGPGAEGRDDVVRRLGNNNLLAMFTSIANGWIQNLAVCTTWAQRVVAQYRMNGALSYETARSEAERLATELARVSDRTPDTLSRGVVDPRIASPSRRDELSPRGPVTAGALPVDISAASQAAMREKTAVESSWWKAKALAAAARR